MKILVLNGSPRENGNTAKMCNAFAEAVSDKHEVTMVHAGALKIAGCTVCNGCKKSEDKKCVQNDGMQELYPLLSECDMIVIGSPIYYLGFSGQIASMFTRFYAIEKLANVKKSALFLAAGDAGVFDGPVAQYKGCFPRFMNTEDMGVFTVSYAEKNLEDTLAKIKEMAASL